LGQKKRNYAFFISTQPHFDFKKVAQNQKFTNLVSNSLPIGVKSSFFIIIVPFILPCPAFSI